MVKMMNNQFVLSEVVDIISGGTPKTKNQEYWNGEIPWLSVKDFNNENKRVFESEKTITNLGLKNSAATLLAVNDVIISARGTVGVIAQIGRPMAFNQSCYGLRAKNEVLYDDYLYYLLKSEIKQVQQSTHGSVFDTITRDTFNQIEVSLPPLPTQRRIAAILSSLDDKIENNRRICEKLEEMAQAIFKQWFVDFNFPDENGEPYKDNGGEMVESELGLIPKGWALEKTKQLFDFIVDNRGKTPPTTENGRKLVENWHISGDVLFPDFNKGKKQKYVSEDTYNNWFRNGHPIGWDILYSTVGTLNKVSFVPPNCEFCIAQNIVAFRLKNEIVSQFYFYNYMLSRHFIEQAHGRVIETVQASIKLTDIYTMDILVPKIKTIGKFDEIVKPIYEKLYNIFLENEKLQKARDALLPKLMSGEIDVEEKT